MMKRSIAYFATVVLAAIAASCSPSPFEPPAVPRQEQLRWLTLPAPRPLPTPVLSSSAHVNGIDLHYSTYGDTKAPPLIFLHGGMGNSENWGNQVGAFAERYRVILIDSRGHGRSTRDARPFGYDLMADDVIALMDKLRVRKGSIAGWATAVTSVFRSLCVIPSGWIGCSRSGQIPIHRASCLPMKRIRFSRY